MSASVSQPAGLPLWQASFFPRFVLRYLDGDQSALAFDCEAGNTHLLSLLEYELLQSLQARVQTLGELTQEFADLLPDGTDVPALLEARLSHLQSMGMLSCQASS